MAIVEMQKMRLLAMKRDRVRILNRLQKMGCVQVVEESGEEAEEFRPKESGKLEEISKQIERLEWAIQKIKAFDPIKKPLLAPKPVMSDDDLLAVQASKSDVLEIVRRLEEIDRSVIELWARETKELQQIRRLAPWETLDVPLEKLGQGEKHFSTLIVVPGKGMKALEEGIAQFQVEPVLEKITSWNGAEYFFVIGHNLDLEKFREIVRENAISEENFSEFQGTAEAAIDQFAGRLARIEEVRRQLAREVESLGKRSQELRLLRDALQLEANQIEAAGRFLETDSAFVLTAWVPKERREAVEKAIRHLIEDYSLEFRDPLEEEKPPTELHNRKAIRPFESIVKLYSYPDPRGIDPTAVMMPFYACFFGLMLSDAAYGIILGVLAAFAVYKLKGKGGTGAIAGVMVFGAIATVFWGAMLGSWFGIEDIRPLIGFTPMSDPIKMMILCLALGAVQLLTGLCVAMYMNLKRHKVVDAICDQGFWLLLLIGLGMFLLNSQVAMVMAIVGAGGIVVTGGRSKKGFGKITGGLGSLYGISSYISDLLSYARLFGMGLATGVIAMVFNNVANMFMGGVIGTVVAVIILIIGHVFNLGINVLGAYVHACRLQYIEFFGKFYEDGGTPFKPLTTEGKYVDFESDLNRPDA